MKDLLVHLLHLLTTIAKLLGPGGAKAVVADSLLMKQQLLVINRSRSPNGNSNHHKAPLPRGYLVNDEHAAGV